MTSVLSCLLLAAVPSFFPATCSLLQWIIRDRFFFFWGGGEVGGGGRAVGGRAVLFNLRWNLNQNY